MDTPNEDSAASVPEHEPRTVEDIIHEAHTAIWKDSEYFTAQDVFALEAALAAERDRADRAEAALKRVRQQLETTSYHPLKDPLFKTLRDAGATA